MTLVFEDAAGDEGIITSSLEVGYAGRWEEDVRLCVERVEDDHRTGGDPSQKGEIFTTLVIELPENAPIITVERRRLSGEAYQ